MLSRTGGESILSHRVAYVVSCFRCSAAQMELVKQQYSNLLTTKDSFLVHDQRLHRYVYYHSRDIHTHFILNVKNFRTFSNV